MKLPTLGLVCVIFILVNLLAQAVTDGKPQFFVASQMWMAAYVIILAIDQKPTP